MGETFVQIVDKNSCSWGCRWGCYSCQCFCVSIFVVCRKYTDPYGLSKNHNCSDQSTMQHELLYSSSMSVDPAWDAVEGPIWPQEVRVAYQEHMQSFHQATAITVGSDFFGSV